MNFILMFGLALLLVAALSRDKPHQPLKKNSGARLMVEFMHVKRISRHFPPKKFPFIQFTVQSGSPVFSIAKGEVLEASYMRSYGKNVVIQSGDSLLIRYFHLSEILVDSGETIKPGQKIGKTGSSGLVTAPALGIKVTANSVDVDPCRFMDCESFRTKPETRD